MARKLFVFDTTLRDGEQSPGAAMTPTEKYRMAIQLEQLGVDTIEAGFPVTSDGEFAAVRWIARDIRGSRIAAMTRAATTDMDRTWEAVREAAHPRLNIILPASDIHLFHQLGKSREEAIQIARYACSYARILTGDVEFSAVDATRADRTFLCLLLEAAIDAGATTVGIADTVGIAVPGEFGALVRYLLDNVRNMEDRTLSVHCHDDLGMAVANTLAAVEQGAGQVKCTINGIGERAGNAALEEVVMALKTREDYYSVQTDVRTEQLYETSRLLTEITGLGVQANKAIVGANAFAHGSGIHQDAMIKDGRTYEIISPRSVGASGRKLIFSKHSGRRALRLHLEEAGINPSPEMFDRIYRRFKAMADFRKLISVADLEALMPMPGQK